MRLVYYERGGGAQEEFYAAQGSFTSWGATGNWRLVGDTIHGGLAVSITAPVVGGIADAERVISNPAYQVWKQSEVAPYINYLNGPLPTGSGGEAANGSASILALNPDAYWRMDAASGTLQANLGAMGTAFDGTYVGGVTLGAVGPTGAFGSPNRAVTFNGTNAAMTTTQVGYLSNRSAFTMAGWINPANFNGSRVGLFGQNDTIEFGFDSGRSLTCWTAGGGSVSTTYPFAANTWHHVAVVGDGVSLRLYLDGTLVSTGGGSTTSYGASAFPINVGGGGIWDSSGNWFPGSIDELAVFPRALSAADIGVLGKRGDTVTHYTLNDRTFPGMTINDNHDDFVAQVQAGIYIPASGAWTFGVNSDEGYSLTLTTRTGANLVSTFDGMRVRATRSPRSTSPSPASTTSAWCTSTAPGPVKSSCLPPKARTSPSIPRHFTWSAIRPTAGSWRGSPDIP